jgi:hypothetical protein
MFGLIVNISHSILSTCRLQFQPRLKQSMLKSWGDGFGLIIGISKYSL